MMKIVNKEDMPSFHHLRCSFFNDSLKDQSIIRPDSNWNLQFCLMMIDEDRCIIIWSVIEGMDAFLIIPFPKYLHIHKKPKE